jgi:hypothetical protein
MLNQKSNDRRETLKEEHPVFGNGKSMTDDRQESQEV